MTKDIEAKFLEINEGTSPEIKKLREEIETDPALRESFTQYKKVQELEQRIAQERFSVSHDFSEKVMAKLEPQPKTLLKRVCSMIHLKNRYLWHSVAVCFLLILAVSLSWKHEYLLQHVYTSDTGSQEDSAPSLPVESSTSRPSSSTAKQAPTKKTPSEGLVRPPAVSQDSTIEAISSVPKKSATESHATGSTEERSTQLDFASGAPRIDERKPAISIQRERRDALMVAPLAAPALAPGQEVYQEPVDRETYVHYEESERVSVRTKPVSTFSIDVDTGSYTNTRRFLQQGQKPPTDSVRVEEFINYFKYDYPSQTEKPFGLTYEVAPSPLDPARHLLRLGIKAKDASVIESPWNLVFLIDVSGSMNTPDKLPLVKQALKILVGEMREQDKVSIVTYSGFAGTLLEPTGVKERDKILHAIDSLGAGGGTHGSAGILQAYRLANSARIEQGVNRVILATDGDFNVGITDREKLIELIERERQSGITLTTVGFGSGNYQEATMEQLANKGNGNYFYIDSFKEARKVFQTDLTGTIEVVAKDVKLQMEFNPEQVTEYRLVGYENRTLRNEDFDNDKIDAGEIGSNHTVTALYEIVLADSTLAQEENEKLRYEGNRQTLPAVQSLQDGELGFLKIRYKEPQGEKSKLLEFALERSQVKTHSSKASQDFRFVTAVSGFAHLLRDSRYAGDYTFADVIRVAEGALGEDPHGYRREFVELVKNAQSIY